MACHQPRKKNKCDSQSSPLNQPHKRRSSSSSLSSAVATAAAAKPAVVRQSFLDTSNRLPAVEFPMQFNFGSAYGSSVNVIFNE